MFPVKLDSSDGMGLGMTDKEAGLGYSATLSEDPARVRIVATTLGDLLLGAYDRAPDKEALVFPEGRKTYAELVEAVLHKARALLALGVNASLVGGAYESAELDAKRAIDQASRMAAEV